MMNEIEIYTPERPMVTVDGSLWVSIEALLPGHMIMIRSYGYVGDGAPIGWYVGMVIEVGPPEPVVTLTFGEDNRMCTYPLTVLLAGDRDFYLDRRDVIEGTIYEFVC